VSAGISSVLLTDNIQVDEYKQDLLHGDVIFQNYSFMANNTAGSHQIMP
jgi:hypothetical protein